MRKRLSIALCTWLVLTLSTTALAGPPPTPIHAPLRASGTINLNTASADDLTRHLKGVGPAKAAAIVDHRKRFGPYRTIGELGDVKGFGEKTVERLRPQLRLE